MPAHIKASLLGPSLQLPVARRAARARHVAGHLPLRAARPRRRAVADRRRCRASDGLRRARRRATGWRRATGCCSTPCPTARACSTSAAPRATSRGRCAERGCAVVGIEADARAAEVARARRASEVVVGDVEDAGDRARRSTGPFDRVLFGDVLEHLRDPAAVLRWARDAARPGRRAVVSLPNIAHWTARRAAPARALPAGGPRPLRPHAPALLHARDRARARRAARAWPSSTSAFAPRAAAAREPLPALGRLDAGLAQRAGPSSSRSRSC